MATIVKPSPGHVEASRRVQKAEEAIYKSLEHLDHALRLISVVTSGLNQQYSKIDVLKQSLKSVMYDLERCRETGNCACDEPTMRMIEGARKADQPTRRRKGSRRSR